MITLQNTSTALFNTLPKDRYVSKGYCPDTKATIDNFEIDILQNISKLLRDYGFKIPNWISLDELKDWTDKRPNWDKIKTNLPDDFNKTQLCIDLLTLSGATGIIKEVTNNNVILFDYGHIFITDGTLSFSSEHMRKDYSNNDFLADIKEYRETGIDSALNTDHFNEIKYTTDYGTICRVRKSNDPWNYFDWSLEIFSTVESLQSGITWSYSNDKQSGPYSYSKRIDN